MEVAGRKKYSCKYPGCNNWYYVNISGGFVNKHFFNFPKDVHQIQLWKAACKVDEVHNIDNWRICEDHFEAKSFVNERKERLNTGCLPKPYELSSCDLQVQDHTYCGTEEEVNEEVTRDVSSIATNPEERISVGVSGRNENGDTFTVLDRKESPPRTSETGVQTTSKLLQSHRITRNYLSEISFLRRKLQSLNARSRKPTLRRITKQEFYEFVDRHFDENFGKFIKVEYLLNRN
ncbi:hypothetical protein MTP99_018840 [Tenebrio molitor]|nr:hypothetical protein MTP99_018840 [Tenebrio molitor]